MTRNKSIEQLENDFWKEPTEFPTGLVERCYLYRKIPLEKLTIEQLRTLTGQKIGLKFTLDLIIEKLDEDILCAGDFYEGDLLESTLNIPIEYWNPVLAKKFQEIFERNIAKIKSEFSEKDVHKILIKGQILFQQFQ